MTNENTGNPDYSDYEESEDVTSLKSLPEYGGEQVGAIARLKTKKR